MRLLWSDERAARTRKKRTVPKWNDGLFFGLLGSFAADGEAAVGRQVIPCREPAWDRLDQKIRVRVRDKVPGPWARAGMSPWTSTASPHPLCDAPIAPRR